MVPDELRRRLEEIAPRFGIRLALVFGSAVSGATHPRSDFDLALILENPELDFEAYGDLVHEIQQSIPERALDLAIINHADPLFLQRIMASCELVHGSEANRRALELYAFRRYQDHRRFLDMERDYVRRAIAASGSA